jgi:hypothetical protein
MENLMAMELVMKVSNEISLQSSYLKTIYEHVFIDRRLRSWALFLTVMFAELEELSIFFSGITGFLKFDNRS